MYFILCYISFRLYVRRRNSHGGQMVGSCSQAGPAPGWQAMARFSQLAIGESALGVGAVRRSERARLQGLSRSVRAHGGRSACDCARGGIGRECGRSHDLVRFVRGFGMVQAGIRQAGDHAERFRYVIARVDESESTGLAATKLWIDLSKQREGPAGTGPVQLLYGLSGQPLPPTAVKLAADVDAQMRDGLLNVKAARDAGDADALVALAETDDMAWRGSPMLMCAVAEGLIAMKKIPEAATVVDRVATAFPKALRPKQLRGLALARSQQTAKAQLSLGMLYAAGEIDPETLGILARTWMDRYNESGNRFFLLKSRDLYRQAFEAFPTDYYTGINAASKSLLAGEKETAAQLAARVQDVVGEKPVANDYSKTATAAEVQLLQAKYPEAAALYRAAVVTAPGDIASHESSRAQAKLLLQALGASDEQQALVDGAFR